MAPVASEWTRTFFRPFPSTEFRVIVGQEETREWKREIHVQGHRQSLDTSTDTPTASGTMSSRELSSSNITPHSHFHEQ